MTKTDVTRECPDEQETATWRCPGRFCCAVVTLTTIPMLLIACPVCGTDMVRDPAPATPAPEEA